MKIIDYISLVQFSASKLDRAVINRISKGWQPQGGISTTHDGDFVIYAQALVKYEQQSTNPLQEELNGNN